MAQFVTPALLQLLNSSGEPYSGAKLNIYEIGTTTALSLFSDEALSTPAANPVVADSEGIFANVFVAETKFKAVITDSADVTIKSLDPVYTVGASDAVAASNVSYDGTSIGFAATNVQDAIDEVDTQYVRLTGAAFTGALSVTLATAGAMLSLESTDAGASAGPVVDIYRNSASPAASDVMGQITFTGEDDGGNKTTYATVDATIADPTDGSEDGTYVVAIMVGGALTDRITADASGVTVSGTLVQGVRPVLGTLASTQATTSGNNVAFSSIPAGVNEIDVLFEDVGHDAAGELLVQLGDASSFETTGYVATGAIVTDSAASVVNAVTNGFNIERDGATQTFYGIMNLRRMSGNRWIASHSGRVGTAKSNHGGGSKTLTGELTRVRIITTGGGTLDSGTATIFYR